MSRQKEIYQDLQSLSDPKYKEFHGGLVPGEENLLGVRIPALRRYARELFTKSGGRADILLQEIGDSCYEEITLQGMIIGLQRNVPSEVLFAQIKGFVPKIRNWAICFMASGFSGWKKYSSVSSSAGIPRGVSV